MTMKPTTMAASSEKSIFLSALEFETPEDRQGYLEQACAGNPPLREAVDDLLAAHDRPDNVLDSIPEPVGVLREHLESAPMETRRVSRTRRT